VPPACAREQTGGGGVCPFLAAKAAGLGVKGWDRTTLACETTCGATRRSQIPRVTTVDAMKYLLRPGILDHRCGLFGLLGRNLAPRPVPLWRRLDVILARLRKIVLGRHLLPS
jgi:hypothetical protein